jgi:hypothetical protein
MPKILDKTTAEIKEQLLIAMAKMSSQGSVPAAQAAVRMLDDLEVKEIANEHREKLTSGTREEICYYLGKIGESMNELARHLGSDPSDKDFECYYNGVKDRKLEMKAIEYEMVRRGSGKVQNWMKR